MLETVYKKAAGITPDSQTPLNGYAYQAVVDCHRALEAAATMGAHELTTTEADASVSADGMTATC